MATVFKWTGKSAKGAVVKGEFTAGSMEEVKGYLRKQRITPTSVTQKGKPLFSALGGKVTDKDLVIFTRQFATMIGAGLPLVQALDILSKQTENPGFAKSIGEIKSDVEGGSTFADALRKFPKVFSDLYTNMVAAGEAGGIMDTILVRLASYIEKAQKLKRKVKGAMVYPSVVITVAIMVIVIIMVFVVPTFAKMFTQLGGTLPMPTQIIIDLSKFLGGIGGLIMLGSIIAIIVGIVQFRRTETGQMVTDRIILRLPVVGILFRKVAVAKFTRTLGTLISSGVPILDGLNITAKTAGNRVIEKAVMEVRQGVSEGRTIAEPLTQSKVFPPMVTQMIAVGESTGALDNMLGKIADFYDEEVDQAVGNLTSMIEPVLMIFLGGTIGFIVVAMYLPIFKLITLVK
ncbi:MAG: type II secretion system F family protein [Nitrospirae bacterium]|nr:type II secretion system F family protein [Nitrospirota bacterium]